MKKDYAKTNHRYYKSKRRSKGKWILWPLLFLIVAGGSIVWVMQGGRLPSIEALQQKKVTKVQKTRKAEHPKATTTPRFDFYTLLPQDEVAIPDSHTAKAETAAPEKSTNVSPEKNHRNEMSTADAIRTWQNPNKVPDQKTIQKKGFYYLQAGAFTHYSEADQLRARLGLMGHASAIKVDEQNGIKTYRVILGPFGNRTTAQVKQLALSKDTIPTFIVGDMRE